MIAWPPRRLSMSGKDDQPVAGFAEVGVDERFGAPERGVVRLYHWPDPSTRLRSFAMEKRNYPLRATTGSKRIGAWLCLALVTLWLAGGRAQAQEQPKLCDEPAATTNDALAQAARARFYHLSTGSELLPLFLL